jgi:bifunctional DNA-binding transcriptional regulator/antitoxin component of YhaV-PrlF toxin-antitoxin module
MLPAGSREFRIPEITRNAVNTTSKIQHRGLVTIPTSVRRQAGLSKGDLVSFTFARGQIVITPKLLIDRSKFPTADDEYTTTQRRIIDERLAKADDDIKHGRMQGPFDSHKEFIASLHKEAKKLGVKKTKRPIR